MMGWRNLYPEAPITQVLTGYVHIKAAISEIPRNIRYRDSHAGYSRRESGPGWEGVGTVGYGV